MIRLSDVAVRRSRQFELQVPSWEVGRGSVVGLVGPNGAGKTTLLHLLLGLLRADRGTVAVHGLDPIKEVAEVRRNTGFMTPDVPVWKGSVERCLWAHSGYYPTWNADLAEQLRDRFALDPRARVTTLSRGGKVRLRLVLALSYEPPLLVLDEPTLGLDVDSRDELQDELGRIVGEGERTVILTSHRLDDVQRLADRIVLLRGGRIVADGPTEELCAEASLEDLSRSLSAPA